MPPKERPAAAKKQTASKAKAKAKAKAQPVAAAEIVLADVTVVDGSSSKRRQLNRRGSDKQALRYLKRKLGDQYDERPIRNLRNTDGDTCVDFVKWGMKLKKCKQGRLSSKFAVGLFVSFNLESSVWGSLPEPTEGV